MTTAMDIIDTAVKIGLGALISGVTTYFVANKKFRHESSKDITSKRMEILESVALSLQKANSSLQKSVGIYYQCKKSDLIEDVLPEILDKYDFVFNEMDLAEGYIFLLGDEELTIKIEDLSEAIMNLYLYFRDYTIDNPMKPQKLIDEINHIRSDLPKTLSRVFQQSEP